MLTRSAAVQQRTTLMRVSVRQSVRCLQSVRHRFACPRRSSVAD